VAPTVAGWIASDVMSHLASGEVAARTSQLDGDGISIPFVSATTVLALSLARIATEQFRGLI
jgi:hypothetical protein